MSTEGKMERTLNALRRAGWRVAVHNDYSHGGFDFTFWLFTHPSGLYVKGEGLTDMDALMECDVLAAKMFRPSP